MKIHQGKVLCKKEEGIIYLSNEKEGEIVEGMSSKYGETKNIRGTRANTEEKGRNNQKLQTKQYQQNSRISYWK
jgi:hypothetical protein